MDFLKSLVRDRMQNENASSSTNLTLNIIGWAGWVMVFNATFNNISGISWQSVLLMEETGIPGESP